MVEMASRAYDACLACATHMLPGQMHLEIVTVGPDRKELQRPSRSIPYDK